MIGREPSHHKSGRQVDVNAMCHILLILFKNVIGYLTPMSRFG